MAAWLKTFREGNPLSPRNTPDELRQLNEDAVFYEPLSVNTDGSPKLTKHGEPMGKPSWAVGDLVGTYWGGSYAVSDVWVVQDKPYESGDPNWAWETPVRLLAKDESVTLTQLGVRHESMMRRVRLRLRPEQEKILRGVFKV